MLENWGEMLLHCLYFLEINIGIDVWALSQLTNCRRNYENRFFADSKNVALEIGNSMKIFKDMIF